MVKCVGERRDNYRSLPPLPLPAVGTHVIEAASHISENTWAPEKGLLSSPCTVSQYPAEWPLELPKK